MKKKWEGKNNQRKISEEIWLKNKKNEWLLKKKRNEKEKKKQQQKQIRKRKLEKE